MNLQSLTLEQEIVLIGLGGLAMFVAFVFFVTAHDYIVDRNERMRRLDGNRRKD